MAATLVVSVAVIKKNMEPTTNHTLSTIPVRATGSHIASPKMTTVALVTREPTNARATMPEGSPTNCPTTWER